MGILEWSENSVKFLEKLDGKSSERIVRKMNVVKDEPMRYIERLEGKGYGKIRIGHFRLFVDYLFNEDKLFVRAIRFRKNAYN